MQTFFFKAQCDQMDAKAKEGKEEGRKRGKGATVSRPEGRVALLQQQGVGDANVLEFMGCIEMVRTACAVFHPCCCCLRCCLLPTLFIASHRSSPFFSSFLSPPPFPPKRAVDIISEYLRKQANAAGTERGPLSPTPGPGSPMLLHGDTHAPADLDGETARLHALPLLSHCPLFSLLTAPFPFNFFLSTHPQPP